MTLIVTALRPRVVAFYMPERPNPRIPTPTESVDPTMIPPRRDVRVYVTTFYDRERAPISSHMGEVEPSVRKRTERQAYSSESSIVSEAWANQLERAHAPHDVVSVIERNRDDLATRDLVEYTAEWYEVTL